MKRKTFLIQILVLLFTFQNIWSVAEAACLHEMPNIPNSILSNPIDLDEKSDSPSQALYSLENYKEIYDYCQKVCFNEKCSHFSNTIVIQIDPPDDLKLKANFETGITPTYLGITFYKSPYLNQLTPPPVTTGLYVDGCLVIEAWLAEHRLKQTFLPENLVKFYFELESPKEFESRQRL